MAKLKFLVWVLAVGGLIGFTRADGAGMIGYKILRKTHLEGDGGWDFIVMDNDARRLYVTHANSVQVLDADTLKLVGTVEDVNHPHGVVILPELGRGYATSGEPGSVVVFDLKTLRKIQEIPTHQADTDVILYDRPSGHIFTFNGDSHNATVIDPKTDRVLKVLPLGGDPEFAVSDGNGYIYDDLESKSAVLRINTQTLEIEKRWPIKPGETPSGLAMDRKHQRLFIGCRDKKMVVMNAANGQVVRVLPIGGHVDTTYFDPASQTVFNSCGDGTLSVIREDSPDKYSVLEDAATEPGARTMAFDPKTGDVFSDTARIVPKTPTKDDPKPRHKFVPGSFEVLEIGK
jgi:DNA-binding beta-propeller fold protein YncE